MDHLDCLYVLRLLCSVECRSPIASRVVPRPCGYLGAACTGTQRELWLARLIVGRPDRRNGATSLPAAGRGSSGAKVGLPAGRAQGVLSGIDERALKARVLALEPNSVAVVLGTRPEAIKMAEVVRLLGPAALLIHTGQHYSDALWSDVADDVGLPPHDVGLGVGGRPRSSQIGDAVSALGEVFRGVRSIQAVVVHGDTNATLAGALAANAEDIALFHVEAGLRSHDRRMPEEHNRIVVDHLADLCLTPTREASANLRAEAIPHQRIQLTGNTIVDAVHRLLPAPPERGRTCRRYGVEPGGYVLATLHRRENSDNPFRLTMIFDDLRSLGLPVLFPMHPRTRQTVSGDRLEGIRVIDPVPPKEFLALLGESRLVITDSGGVQEETTVLGRRAVVVRRSTERPESLAGSTDLAEPGPGLRRTAKRRLSEAQSATAVQLDGPYGDGAASARIVNAVASVVLDGSLRHVD
jgi:UDP-N-acetylglucosamine 2-epimerase (non-hydrolysing)